MKVIIVIYFLCVAFTVEDKLIFAAVFVRDGVRTMLTNIYKLTDNKNFTEHLGRLTDIGKRQMYLLGRQIDYTYRENKKLISIKYNPRDIFVNVSGEARSVESALSFMYGFYPNGTGPKLTEEQSLQAVPSIQVEDLENIWKELKSNALPEQIRYVPIHTKYPYNEFNNKYLYSPHINCPSLKDERKKYSYYFDYLEKNNSERIYNLGNECSIEVYSIKEASDLVDELNSLEANAENAKVKDECKKNAASLKQFLKDYTIYSHIDTERSKKLLSYVMLSSLRDCFEQAVNVNISEDEKLKMYISHVEDIHLLVLTKIFFEDESDKLDNGTLNGTHFASSIIFELYNTSEGYKIKALYNNQSVNFIGEKRLDYNNFKNYINEFTYKTDKDFYDSCNYKEDKMKHTIFVICLFAVFVVSVGTTWVVFICKMKRSMSDTTEEQDDANKLDPMSNYFV